MSKITFNGNNLKELLQRVNLKGTIDEGVLEIKNGVGTISAVDRSNTIFVSVQGEVTQNKENVTLGIGKLSLLSNFLEGVNVDNEQGEIESDEKAAKWLTLHKLGAGKIKVLLLEKDLVTANPKGDSNDIKERLAKMATIELPLNKGKVEELIKYIGLIGCDTVLFLFDSEGNLSATNSPNSEQQFSLELIGTPTEPTSVEVYSQYLLSVLKTIKWSAEETPTIGLGLKVPIVIKQNENNLWALTPIIA